MDQRSAAALLPLALGHDQDASACPWVAITHRTADYPSRKAQLAIAVANRLVPATSDIIDVLYQCDHCGRCRAASTLVDAPDLPRVLWSLRAALVDDGAVPEVSKLAELTGESGNQYGDQEVCKTVATLQGDDDADVLFVPGASTLSMALDVALATVDILRSLNLRVTIHPDMLDSGQELRELGLAVLANDIQAKFRQLMAKGDVRLVIAGTPKDAFGLREALGDRQLPVAYAGHYIAERFDGLAPRIPNGIPAVFFHPSEVLLHRSEGFEAIDRWLGWCLGDRYRRETDPSRNAFPAAIERPALRVSQDLTRKLAEQRLQQILTQCRVSDERLTILTSDPYSMAALRDVAPPNVDVLDLLIFASRTLGKEVALGS